jgi:DNA-binding response OmpR family regulator
MTITSVVSRFEIVPVANVPRPDSTGESLTDGSLRRPVVLIVDDEQIIADTRVAIFTSWGFTAIAVYDSAEALSTARVIPPDLLISDVTLSGMNGVDLAIEIQKNVPDCKVMLVSGQAISADLFAHAREAGHNFTMLIKPVHPSEMEARLSELGFRQRFSD